MEKSKNLEILKFENEEILDVEVQYCDGDDCYHDCTVFNMINECDAVWTYFT
jgi:hypothetical protein